jgi:hypothetical protein
VARFADFDRVFGITILRCRDSTVVGPRRHVPKFADGLCRHADVRVHLDPHLIWQASKSDVERGNAFRLVVHGRHQCLPPRLDRTTRLGTRQGARQTRRLCDGRMARLQRALKVLRESVTCEGDSTQLKSQRSGRNFHDCSSVTVRGAKKAPLEGGAKVITALRETLVQSVDIRRGEAHVPLRPTVESLAVRAIRLRFEVR